MKGPGGFRVAGAWGIEEASTLGPGRWFPLFVPGGALRLGFKVHTGLLRFGLFGLGVYCLG